MPANSPSAGISLRLLGGFSLERDGQPCEPGYKKGKAILAYLAAEPGRVHSRAFLANMFWPGMPHEAALNNLRQVLRDLRRVLNAAGLAESPLQVDRESIRLNPVPGFMVDVTEFSAYIPVCQAAPFSGYCTTCYAQREMLAGLFGGEFMEGFALPECAEFEDWLQVRREAMHLRALELLARLSDCHERSGAYAKSLPFALRLLELEPWDEAGVRRVMRLFSLNGQHDSALGQYETSCRVLKTELGVLPSEETRALAERIRSCGPSRSADFAPAPATAEVQPLPVTERRQVTVLYCELMPVGVEDPDESMALLHAPQASCREIIRGYSGHLVQIHGGGLLAYFGYPQAGENAARLAVQAALALTHTAFPGIVLRAGIHTGMVISGGEQQVPDAIGATSGLAIHLRQLANKGELLISGATQRLVAGYFQCISLGHRRLLGSVRPLEVFKVMRDSGATSRLEAAGKLSQLVGRQDEIATLRAAWQDALQGQRRVLLLCGEAGIGKSRLVFNLKETLREQAHVVRELRCFPEHRQSLFYPLIAMYRAMLAFEPDDTPAAKFDKLAGYVEAHHPETGQDAVPLLAKLLSLPLREPYRELVTSPHQQREDMLALILGRLYALAARAPLLLVVEDLHWADPSTLELLKLIDVQHRPSRILVVFTARPEFQPPWNDSSVLTLNLPALDASQTATLIASVTPDITLCRMRSIIERADGIPLFAEELAEEAAVNSQSAIPSTLQDLLAARLDGMGEAKRVAQLAATIGREFSINLLRQVANIDDATLAQLVRQLQAAGFLRGDAAGFLHFRHALMRDAAYQSQTRAESDATHRRIANALKTSADETPPELLAQHWGACGEIREAIACWIAAGKLAGQNSASQEAVAHFESGLALIENLPDDATRKHLELELQIGLEAAVHAAQDHSSAVGTA